MYATDFVKWACITFLTDNLLSIAQFVCFMRCRFPFSETYSSG